MSADETAWWSDRAAMLDPDAYEFVTGTSQSRTVPGGENWYLLQAWFVIAASGGHKFNRQGHIDYALPLPEGTTVETRTTGLGGVMYICKPSLVTGSDTGGPGGSNRYTNDPRALFWNRIRRIETELTQYEIGAIVSDSSQPSVDFPTDFTNGLLIHASVHDVAWITTATSGGGGAAGGLNEISDSDRARFAEPNLLPFKRTSFPKILVQGVGQTEGRAVFTYVKLPGDW